MVTITHHPATHHKIYPASATIPDDTDSPQGNVEVGDLWPDTSSGLTYKACTSISPITFTAVGGSSFAASDITGQTEQIAPGSGDFLVIYDTGLAALRKIDWDTLPGAGAGISNVIEDTTPQLGGDLDANGNAIQFDDATGIQDDSGNEQITFQKAASAVNNLEVTNAATGSGATLGAVGDDTDVDLLLTAQGAGVVKADGVQVADLSSSQTLTNKTLTTPTVGDLSNMNHTHAAAGATGGTVAHSATSGQGTDDHHAQLHAAAHADGGADELAVQDLASDSATDGQVAKADGAGGVAFEDDSVVINFIIDGGGSAITTGEKGHVEIPFAMTITGWTIVADQSGSIVVDVWKDTYANFPPTVADTIAGSEKPTLSTAQKNQDLTLTTWTTAVTAGDILAFNVDSITTVTRVTVAIRGIKT